MFDYDWVPVESKDFDISLIFLKFEKFPLWKNILRFIKQWNIALSDIKILRYPEFYAENFLVRKFRLWYLRLFLPSCPLRLYPMEVLFAIYQMERGKIFSFSRKLIESFNQKWEREVLQQMTDSGWSLIDFSSSLCRGEGFKSFLNSTFIMRVKSRINYFRFISRINKMYFCLC